MTSNLEDEAIFLYYVDMQRITLFCLTEMTTILTFETTIF